MYVHLDFTDCIIVAIPFYAVFALDSDSAMFFSCA